MQPGFAAKKAKTKAKKAARRKAKKEAAKHGGDASMGEAAEVQDVSDDIDYTMPSTHKSKMEARKQLKVKVQQLKAQRSKVSKLPANKAARKQLTEHLKEAIKENKEASKKGGKAPAAAEGKADGSAMME